MAARPSVSLPPIAVVVITEGSAAESGKSVDEFTPIAGLDVDTVTFSNHNGRTFDVVLAQVGWSVNVV